MRVMGIDHGDKRTGIALSDEMLWTAQGLEVIQHNGDEEGLIDRLSAIVQQYDVQEIVIGLPKNMDGTTGERGDICIAFADTIKHKLNLPVHLWDERLTTASARRALLEADVSRRKRKKVIDKMAAAILLQSYLDSRGR